MLALAYFINFQESIYLRCYSNVYFKAQFGGNSAQKVFINVCHCSQLPPPTEDIDEDELAERLDSQMEPHFKIPICIGNLEEIYDKNNEPSIKVSILN